MLEILQNEGNLVAVKLAGKGTDDEYHKFVRVVQDAAGMGDVHLLVQFDSFIHWDPHTLWENVRLEHREILAVKRLAFVGDSTWETWFAKIAKPFMNAQVQSFPSDQYTNAQKWVQEGLQDYED